ncbi:hypothetical protein CBM2606_A30018 [Cupriavidus taiwanensis]|nr:hypothetical protein CBM2606_A30018 [Cupriavidus taiwanensis]
MRRPSPPAPLPQAGEGSKPSVCERKRSPLPLAGEG